ncbi:MAG: methionyl-tRNA formyltransferase [Clostridia bacterium]|nr:methionyl-tRNA formyltransferase [Clostridia bacterium]
MRIVFMGTPDFAVPCLDRLVSDGHEVVGVFTQPDKPKGRGNKMTMPPVKEKALEYGIEVFQPRSMRDGEALEILKRLNPELVVVTAFGKILPAEILNEPKYGCINIHASLLPRYRGAAPIQWSVINGESETGVTSMQMDVGLDTGDMLISESVPISQEDTAETVHDRLSVLGGEVLSKTVDALIKGELQPKKQDDSASNYAPVLTKELSPIDFTQSAQSIHNKIRGLYPWPSASTVINDKRLKIHSARVAEDTTEKPGTVVSVGDRLTVSCGDGKCIEFLTVQAEGKKAMSAQDYMRGNRIEKGTVLS